MGTQEREPGWGPGQLLSEVCGVKGVEAGGQVVEGSASGVPER